MNPIEFIESNDKSLDVKAVLTIARQKGQDPYQRILENRANRVGILRQQTKEPKHGSHLDTLYFHQRQKPKAATLSPQESLMEVSEPTASMETITAKFETACLEDRTEGLLRRMCEKSHTELRGEKMEVDHSPERRGSFDYISHKFPSTVSVVADAQTAIKADSSTTIAAPKSSDPNVLSKSVRNKIAEILSQVRDALDRGDEEALTMEALHMQPPLPDDVFPSLIETVDSDTEMDIGELSRSGSYDSLCFNDVPSPTVSELSMYMTPTTSGVTITSVSSEEYMLHATISNVLIPFISEMSSEDEG